MYAVCADGIGTSPLSRKLIQGVARELGHDTSDTRASCIGVQGAIGTNTDVFVTGPTTTKNIPDMPGVEKAIVVSMISDLVGMKEALESVLKKAEMAGKVGKL